MRSLNQESIQSFQIKLLLFSHKFLLICKRFLWIALSIETALLTYEVMRNFELQVEKRPIVQAGFIDTDRQTFP